MATTKRHSFDQLPASLQKFIRSGETFTELQRIFRMMLTQLRADLTENERDSFKAVRAFVVLEFLKSEFADFAKQVKGVHHIQSTKALPSVFEEAGVPEIPLHEGFKVEVKPEFFCSIKKANRDDAYEWLREHDLGAIIRPEVNAKVLNSTMQEYMQETGEEPPQELISTYIMPVAKCKRSRVTKNPLEKAEPLTVFEGLFADEY